MCDPGLTTALKKEDAYVHLNTRSVRSGKYLSNYLRCPDVTKTTSQSLDTDYIATTPTSNSNEMDVNSHGSSFPDDIRGDDLMIHHMETGSDMLDDHSCKPKASLFCWRKVLTAVSTSLLFGYSVAVLNSCSPFISYTFNWCGDDPANHHCYNSILYQTTTNSILYLGAILGAYFGGNALDRSRKMCLQMALFFYFLGAFVGLTAANGQMLCFSRVLTGIGVGMTTITVPVYISEIATPFHRGFFGMIHQITIGLGVFAGILVGLPQVLVSNPYGNPYASQWWRICLALPAAVSVIGLVSFALGDYAETPHLLLKMWKSEEALETLKRIYGVSNVNEISQAALEIALSIAESESLPKRSTLSALADDFYRPAVIVGIGLACLQQTCGINAIVSTSSDLFSKCGLSVKAAAIGSTVMGAANAISTIAAAPLIDNWGRRRLLLLGVILQFISLLPVVILENTNQLLPASAKIDPLILAWISVGSSVTFVTAFAFALGPVTWIYISEIYPIELRSSALGTCGFINWMCCSLVVFSSKFLSVSTTFTTFCAISFVGIIFVFCCIVETKGCSLENSPMTPRSSRSEASMACLGQSHLKYDIFDDVKLRIQTNDYNHGITSIVSSICSYENDENADQTNRRADVTRQEDAYKIVSDYFDDKSRE